MQLEVDPGGWAGSNIEVTLKYAIMYVYVQVCL